MLTLESRTSAKAFEVWMYTDVSHIVSDFQIVDERGAELGVEVEDVEQIVAVHAVQVAVRERAHAAVAAAHRAVYAGVFAENIVLA